MISLLRRFFTSRRLSYAWLTAGLLWPAWFISLLFGSGNVDLAGQPIGTDYLQFYAAGTTVQRGDSARLYDMAYQAELEQEIIGPDLSSYHAFITPPFLSWLFVPFSGLPYALSFIVWSLLGLGLLGASVVLLETERPGKTFLWCLTWFPVFATISFGQNALISVAIVSAAYGLWRRGNVFLAGLALSLMMYKPQLALGFLLWWVLDIRSSWRALVGWGLGTGALVAFCFLAMPEASMAYVDFALRVLPDLPNWHEFPIWHLHTPRGMGRMLLPSLPRLADGLTLLLAGAACWAGTRLVSRYRNCTPILFSTALCVSLWVTPHAMIYDWALLLVPAVLIHTQLPKQRERWRVLYALVWITSLISGPLTYFQLQLMPMALQISVPVLGLVYIAFYRDLMHPATSGGELWLKPSAL
jgi:alpha-1,2-mannosyltransferase